MNLEEARKVLWLKSNPRPLGELLDEGYLTLDRLEWAAKWAYNYKLKEAARVLLDAMKAPEKEAKVEQKAPEPTVDKSIPISMTLEKARSIPWPFSPYKGQPMGSLVESKQLNLKDLGYAIENARDEKVQQAAIALSLIRLDQVINEPAPSAGYVHVVSGGRSYSERRESLLILLQGMFLGLILAGGIYFGSRSFNTTRNSEAKTLTEIISQPGGMAALGIVLLIVIGLVWLVNFTFDKINDQLAKQIEYYRLGQEGEDKVVQLIVQALDGNWHLFRNVGLPGRNKGDLDLVLVGPPGVWVLEVKNLRGEYRNIGDRWDFKRGKDWKTASVNPSRQAEKYLYRLKNFLKADSINVFVNSAVIWANHESSLIVENPSVAVWQYDRIHDELGNIWQGEKLSESERNKITLKLTKLCEEQRKNQEKTQKRFS